MKFSYSWALLGIAGAVSALSSSGQRLLVVLEDAELKGKYSQFLGDLECTVLVDRSIATQY